MQLFCFGNLTLENAGESHTSPYIALLALCYLVIEKEKDHRELAEMVQADDAGKEVKVLRSGENFRNQEIESKALRNYRKNISVLEKKVNSTLLGKDEFKRDIIIHPEFSSDVTKFLELVNSSDKAAIDKAIALYERGPFLVDFEKTYNKGKLKRHYSKAIELQNWVEQQRNRFYSLYIEAKAQRGEETLTLKDLKRLLPLDVDVNEMNAAKIASFWNKQFAEKDELECKEYLQNYIPNHLKRISDEGITQEYIFQVLVAFELIPTNNTKIIQEAFSLSDRDYTDILNELQLDGWFENLDDTSESTKTQTIQVLHGRQILQQRLRSNYSEYIDLVLRLLETANPYQQYDLVKDFLQIHPIVQPSDLKDRLVPLVCRNTHSLINLQEFDKAVDIAESVIQAFEGIKHQHPHELGFWHCYALERNSAYIEAHELLNKLLKEVDVDDEEQEDLYDRLNALKASVLTRTAKGERELKRTKRIAEEVSEGSSDWGNAEALNSLGRLSYALDEDLLRTKSYFNKAALKWGSLGEVARQIGALSNLAVILDRNEKVEEAEEVYNDAFHKAKAKKLYGDVWVRLLLNRAMFYQDCVIYKIAPDPDDFSQKAANDFKLLQIDLEQEEVSPFIKSHAFQNLGSYYQDLGEIDQALLNYNRALEISDHAKLVEAQGLSKVSIGLVTLNFDMIETGIDTLEKGGYQEATQVCEEDYINLLKELEGDKKQTKTLLEEVGFRITQVNKKENN